MTEQSALEVVRDDQRTRLIALGFWSQPPHQQACEQVETVVEAAIVRVTERKKTSLVWVDRQERIADLQNEIDQLRDEEILEMFCRLSLLWRATCETGAKLTALLLASKDIESEKDDDSWDYAMNDGEFGTLDNPNYEAMREACEGMLGRDLRCRAAIPPNEPEDFS